jgi:hypothetical protein
MECAAHGNSGKTLHGVMAGGMFQRHPEIGWQTGNLASLPNIPACTDASLARNGERRDLVMIPPPRHAAREPATTRR